MTAIALTVTIYSDGGELAAGAISDTSATVHAHRSARRPVDSGPVVDGEGTYGYRWQLTTATNGAALLRALSELGDRYPLAVVVDYGDGYVLDRFPGGTWELRWLTSGNRYEPAADTWQPVEAR